MVDGDMLMDVLMDILMMWRWWAAVDADLSNGGDSRAQTGVFLGMEQAVRLCNVGTLIMFLF